MNRHAMYPGSFDPITNGHVDVIERAATMFDTLSVVIGVNSKKTPLFTVGERQSMAQESLVHLSNVAVVVHDGLIVDWARNNGVHVIVRGLRAVTDFEYEFQIALMNKKIESGIDTVFLLPHERYTYLNSSIVRELGRYGQDVSEFVPTPVSRRMAEKFGRI